MNRTTSPLFNELVETHEKFTEALREEDSNVTISKEEHQKLVTERLAFGFDSIYFRYAAVVDELARYKAKDPANAGKDFSNWANCQKMHFYNVLEQLTGAHDLEDSFLKDKDGKYGA